MKRRRVLATTGSSLGIVVAGCLGGGSGDDDDDEEADEPAENSSTDESDDQTDESGEDESDDETGESNDGEGDNEGAPFGGVVEATSQGGYLAIGEELETEARSNGFALPSQSGGNPITISADVDADGNWDSNSIDFEPIPIDDPLEGEIAVEIPNGLSGTLDPDAERMTATGDLVATIRSDGDEIGTIEFTIDATTGESGALSGSAAFDADPASVMLVDNEFEVGESGNLVIDSFASLPAEAGKNWFELDLRLSAG